MNRPKKWLVVIAAVVAVALVASIAAVNPQTPPAATGVTATNTANGVRVSWNDDAAAVHRVGWAHDADARAANAAGDWLEAFHFADTKRNTDYTIKYLPDGQKYWVIVGAANHRFGAAAWSNWSSLTVRTADANTPAPTPAPTSTPSANTPTPEPTATPIPNVTSTPVPTATTVPAATSTPAPTSTPVPTASCSGDDYDRDEWGSYPGVPAGATATWTLPSDNVNNTSLTHDHHVALKDAHVSGGCNWTASRKDTFSSDLDNLNPTTGSFNSSKGSRTPDRLTGIAARIINTDAEKCDYATQHKAVKDEYSLSMTTSERATVNNWLALCSN